MLNKIKNDELLGHKIGVIVGIILGLIGALFVSSKANEEFEYEEVINDEEPQE